MKKFSKIGLLMIAAGLVYLFAIGYQYKNEIKENRAITVCQYSLCKNAPKTSSAYFKYYVDGKIYRTSYLQCPENSSEKLKKFYLLYYSKKNPNKIIVDFTKEVKDSSAIIAAGFKLK